MAPKTLVPKYDRKIGRLKVKQVDAAISEAAKTGKRIDLADGGGLILRCSPNGSATWTYAYRSRIVSERAAAGSAETTEKRVGGMRRVTLGLYGKKQPALTLDAAREARGAEAARKKTGEDPRERQVTARAVQAHGSQTFGTLCELYIEHIKAKGKQSWQNDYGYLIGGPLPGKAHRKPPKGKKEVVRPRAKWGDRVASTITKGEILAYLGTVAAQSRSTANRMQSTLRTLWGWAAERDYVPMNFLAGLKKVGGKEAEKDRVLTGDEIRTFLAALDEPDVQTMPTVRTALKLILLTAQRPGEVAGMMRSELHDLDGPKPHWIIPAVRTKNKKAEHSVPLSPTAVRLVKEALDAGKPEGDDTADRPVFASRFESVGVLARHSLSQAVRRLVENKEIAAFTPHDLRRTAATIVQAARLPIDYVKALLNHNDKGVTAIYARWHMFEEKREAVLAIERAIYLDRSRTDLHAASGPNHLGDNSANSFDR